MRKVKQARRSQKATPAAPAKGISGGKLKSQQAVLDRLISPGAEDVLIGHARRLYEAIGVLELSSDLLTSGPCDKDEQARVMCAIDAALRLLRPIPTEIGCRVSMQSAVERKEVSHG